MKLCKYIILFSLILFCTADAFDWPLKKQVVAGSFCQYNGEGFSIGIHLTGRDEQVFPIAPGEIVFSHKTGEDYFSLPYGLGSFLALWHEGGIHSVYCHLATGSLMREKNRIESDTTIGVVGDTGATIGGTLRLIILNIEENEILNPIKNLIPYYKDIKNPVIKGIYLKRNNEIIELKNNQVISHGKAEILIHSYDLREDKQRVWETAPYNLSFFHNGQRIKQISFDAIREKENYLVIGAREYTYGDIYEGKWMYKMGSLDFHEGRSHILIRVSDFAGNTVSKEIFIIVEKS